ncbi:nuclear transport factor 2 family protein [Colwellia sp. MB02u-10]|jgi:hypothetical protein|uniref:nuclear transport factor 2 family protein n=1 Tax=Colwellia sp. MB02u-10 TaxID=2759828 RepID=UPI0015F6F9DA|nr:nuclear transport factor 2 family protein [Colwellia sp. MB02u-10]MBA6342449.1 nuclear transport factor 2 family protein [Colwellia sp. MB02u-10]
MLSIESKKRPIITSILFLLTLLSFSIQANENKTTSLIWDVIESFKLSIVTKDEALFLSLFHNMNNDNITWVGVISDDTLKALIAKDEKFKQQPKIMNSTPKEFIHAIVNSPQASKEVFKNVKINTDKEVASVSFDYEFFKDEKVSNFGQEHWQLINTKNGWKINAVNFSFTLVI